MITVNGIRNALWCVVAFGIVACAATPMPVDKLAVARTAVERAEQAQAAQFAQVELTTARNKLAAAQAAADKRDADVAARMADQAEVDAQLAEFTARARQQEELVNQMDAGLRDLRQETLRNGAGAAPSAPPSRAQDPRTQTPPN